MADVEAEPQVPFGDAVRFWVKLGFINFGGPTGQIAIMHDELVERRRWIDERRFLHALNFAMLLPGPEAHQLAIYVGWLLHGSPGAIVAGVTFLLPALVLMIALSWVYAAHGDIGWVSAVFEGLAWGVVGIVAAALVRIAPRSLTRPFLWVIAVVAFVALYVLAVPFPLVVLGAGLVGLAAGRLPPPADDADSAPADERVAPTARRTLRVLGVGLAIWLLPLVGASLLLSGSAIAEEALFFAVMALVTFGGAYAVLAYVNQAAVVRFGWLTSGEMAVGLSLAETTPGPLILVVVFVGFLAAYRDPGELVPVAAGIVGGLVTAWATFVPSFLFIFLGAPSVERLRGNTRLGAALAAITAAVVGVIANLALVFAVGVLFEDVDVVRILGNDVAVPLAGSIDLAAAAVATAAFVAMWRFRVNVVWVVLGGGTRRAGSARWSAVGCRRGDQGGARGADLRRAARPRHPAGVAASGRRLPLGPVEDHPGGARGRRGRGAQRDRHHAAPRAAERPGRRRSRRPRRRPAAALRRLPPRARGRTTRRTRRRRRLSVRSSRTGTSSRSCPARRT